MKIVSIMNYKGGVGKTTLTANLGAELAYRGKKILLIDLDPQASLTFSFISPHTWQTQFEKDATIKAWFDSFDAGNPRSLESLCFAPPNVKRHIRNGKLDVIFSHLGLLNVDLELATKLGGANLTQAKRNFISVHRRLAEGLKDIDDSEYDVVLIDCPPSFNIVTKTAIVASEYLLIPARPDYLSTLGIDYLMRSMVGLVSEYNEFASVSSSEEVDNINPSILGVVFTMIREYGEAPIAAQQEFISQIRRRTMPPVFSNYMKHNDTLFADAPQYGVPVVLQHFTHMSHRSVVESVEGVVDEFIAKLAL